MVISRAMRCGLIVGTLAFLGCMVFPLADTHAALVIREPLAPNVYAAIKGGRMLYLECRPPHGKAAQAFFRAYLADPKQWTAYKNLQSLAAIPFAKLNPATQRRVLEAIFPDDYVDSQGWRHTVIFEGEEGVESLWSLCEWLTGKGTSYHTVASHPDNAQLGQELVLGDRVLIPQASLLPVMRTVSERPAEETDVFTLKAEDSDLSYGKDGKGGYALYQIKKGETLYSSVVVRFTDFRENADVHKACKLIQARSKIKDARRMEAGDRVLIPLEILSDRYRPEGSEERVSYEAVRQEAKRLAADRARSKDLSDVVILLDAGHGGRDPGANFPSLGLWEDEITYDITSRLKALLEKNTGAKVLVTMEDPDQGFVPSKARSFIQDKDERVLTTPVYPNQDAKVSSHLRWALANSIYKREIAAGIDPKKILFISIHCDAIYNTRVRGTMVYVPGAKYRDGRGRRPNTIYSKFQESKGSSNIKTTSAERRRDEALSRNFADLIVKSLRTHDPQIAVHNGGSDPIRNVIRQSRGRYWLPAVLRYNKIPTKVLVETANLTNPKDQERVGNYEWRQWYAEALVDAIRKHYAL
jgi:N-acetylmuramoyl-L-alanine amidase